MKWLVGPRRIGKTTKMFNGLMLPGDAIWLSASQRMANLALAEFHRFLTERKIRFESKSEADCILIYAPPEWEPTSEDCPKAPNGLYLWRKWFFGIERYMQTPQTHKEKMLPKYIDEAGLYFDIILGNVRAISGSGPNYKWTVTDEYKGIQKDFREANMPRDDFSFRWGYKDAERGRQEQMAGPRESQRVEETGTERNQQISQGHGRLPRSDS